MKNFLGVFAVTALVCATSFAATASYVVTDDDNPNGNSSTIYSLNTSTGALKQVAVLKTGGQGLGGGFFASYQTAINQSASCIFVLDAGSSDIAAFARTTGLPKKVGNYSNSAVSTDADGGSLSLTPNGKFLYGSYSATENIGVWSVGSTCALTFVETFTPTLGADLFGAIKVDPSGKFLVIPSADFEAVNIATINATSGKLTDAGSVAYTGLSACSEGCFPTGLDITKDSKVVVLGNATISAPSVLTANIGSKGLTNPQYWDLTNAAGVGNVNVPFLSAAAYAGKGPLYGGASGYGPDGIPSGEITANFVESPLSITEENATLITNSSEYQFTIAATGDQLVTGEYTDVLDTFKINSDGSLTAEASVTDNQADGGINFSIFPNTR